MKRCCGCGASVFQAGGRLRHGWVAQRRHDPAPGKLIWLDETTWLKELNDGC